MNKVIIFALPAVIAAYPGFSSGEPSAREVTQVLQRDFKARGQATMDRVVQDGVQRICTETHDKPPAAVAKQLEADQMKTIVYPSGSLMGDWKRAEKMAQSGRGAMWSDKPGVAAGGSCYNCHQISPQETSFGTIGPSLLGFGKKRGNGPDMQRYVYGKIYNAKAFSACSQMPRLGHSGTLTEEQIKDFTALLLDPASPVNQ
jgi:sulfur-oxidizing protein SoxX